MFKKLSMIPLSLLLATLFSVAASAATVNPATGDNSKTGIIIVIVIVCIVAIAALVVMNVMKNKKR